MTLSICVILEQSNERLNDSMSKRPSIDPVETVAAVVRSRLGDFTPSERKAARVLLSNYPVAGLATVNQFAARASVSAPSILRFVARLGFVGYADFQRRLKGELEAQLQSPLMKASSISPSNTRFGEYIGATARNITRTFEGLAPAEVDAVLEILADPKRRIHLVGGRFTEALALYCLRHLRVVRANVSMIEAYRTAWRDVVINLGRRDVLILFDIRRYQDDIAALAKEGNDRGATIVVLTDQWLSPATHFARHVIAAHTVVPSNWDSSVALFAVIEALLASLTKIIWKTAELRMKDIEALRDKPSTAPIARKRMKRSAS